MTSLQNSYREHLDSLPPYTPIEPFEVLSARLGRAPQDIIKMDANENPYGPSPRVLEALSAISFPHIYPDPESRALREALSDFSGVPFKYLLAGSGADELIDLLVRVLLEPGDYILSCPPTFGMYSFDTRMNGGVLVEIPRLPDFSLDLPAIQEAVRRFNPKMLFLAAPNNPDGSLPPREKLLALLEMPTLVVLDEAYIEFVDSGHLGRRETFLNEVPQRQNLVVLRTFSKWAGLAGLRVGYGAFPEWLLPVLWKAKQPYNVNVAASTAAIAALQDAEHLSAVVDHLRQDRQQLHRALDEINWLRPYPTQTNFILNQVTGRDAGALKALLAQEYGILVRYFNTPGLQDHIRISVGRPGENQRLLQALREIGARQEEL